MASAKALTMNSAEALEGASFPSNGKQPRREKSFITTTYHTIRSDPRRPGEIVTELGDVGGYDWYHQNIAFSSEMPKPID